ncbi:MAG: sensor histidine kinase [Bacteroidetes bacterium]|nr:sensor histidine kinase [Bacteroidota bacterium]
MNLIGNWEYRWGNSPIDSEGKPLWLKHNKGDTAWKSINRPSDIPMKRGETDLWISKRLKNYDINNPAVFISRVEKIFEAYLDNNKIYSFGKFTSDMRIPLMGFAWHLIELPKDLNGKTFTLHIRSDYHEIGTYGDIKFGSIDTFITDMVRNNLDETILGIVLIITGVILFIILIFLRDIKSFAGLIIFQISTGIWILANTNLTQVLFYAPRIIFYSDHFALFTSAVGFFLFAAEIIELKYKIIAKRMAQINLLYLLFAIITDIVTYPDPVDTVAPFLILTAIGGLILTWCLIASAQTGNREARIFLLALALYVAFVLADIVNYLNNVVMSKGVYEIQYAHYGGLCFYILLGWIIISRYLDVNKQNITAKEEILKNQRIAFEAVRKEKATQEQFAHYLISSQENERKWIAMELHDSIGQDLLIIKNNLLAGIQEESNPQKLSQYIQSASNITSQALQDVRAIAQNLRPQFLDELGLTTSLESITEKIAASSEIEFEVSIEQIDSLIPAGQEINVFRIVQESLNNIIKHSGASKASITVKKNDDRIELLIEDNGKGIKENYNRTGSGLTGMKERAFMLGGKLEITPRPGGGTKVYLEIPVMRESS